MNLKIIACEIAAREIYHCAAQALNLVTVEFLTQGLHDNSDQMRIELQKVIDAVDPEKFDAIGLGYGLCNNGIVGLQARRLELVIPRAHDCITFLLGSKERYAQEFGAHPGTYYYSSGWLEHRDRKGARVDMMANSGLGDTWRKMQEYEKLVEKYGEDNAKYLVEFLGKWEQHYTHGTLIDFDFVKRLDLDRRVTKICLEKGWEFLRLQGSLDLLQDWLDGRWDEERFLRVPPGQRVAAEFSERIIRAAPAS